MFHHLLQFSHLAPSQGSRVREQACEQRSTSYQRTSIRLPVPKSSTSAPCSRILLMSGSSHANVPRQFLLHEFSRPRGAMGCPCPGTYLSARQRTKRRIFMIFASLRESLLPACRRLESSIWSFIVVYMIQHSRRSQNGANQYYKRQ